MRALAYRATEAGIARIAAERRQAMLAAPDAPEQVEAPVAAPVAVSARVKIIRFPRRPARLQSDRVKTELHRAYLDAIRPHAPTARSIISSIATWHGCTAEDLLGGRRFMNMVKARVDAVVALRRAFPAQSTPWLGRQMNMDHTTILYHLKSRGVK